MQIIEDVLVVGDVNVVRNLFYPQVTGRKGLPIIQGLMAPGGGKSGYTLGSRLRIFEQEGIPANRFEIGIATSAGAYNTLAYCSGQAHLISDIYKRISWLNPQIFKGVFKGDYLGLQYLEKTVRELLDIEALRRCRMDLTIGVADLKANPILHKVKNSPDPVTLAAAASALFPVVPGKEIDGVYCVDGGFTIRSTVSKWMHQLEHEIHGQREIELLFIANRPHPQHEDKVEERIFNMVVSRALRNYPELLQGALSVAPKLRALAKNFDRTSSLADPKNLRVRRCALYPLQDENIYPNEWRRKFFDMRGILTRSRTERFLKAIKPVTWV